MIILEDIIVIFILIVLPDFILEHLNIYDSLLELVKKRKG
jgi:hypothetical protein